MFSNAIDALLRNIGLLWLRVMVGLGMAFGHGINKMQMVGTESAVNFPDPIGLGSETSVLFAGIAEFVCGLLVVIGLATRVNAFAVVGTMAVAAFVVHGGDPLFGKPPTKEFALVYLASFMTVVVAGPGKFSLDTVAWPLIKKKLSKGGKDKKADKK